MYIPAMSAYRKYQRFARPDDGRKFDPLVDYELAGIAIDDTSAGMQYQWWRVGYDATTGNIILYDAQSNPTVLLTIPNVTQLSLTFNQQMQPLITYQLSDDTYTSYLWWYDATIPGYTTITIPDSIYPRLTLDLRDSILIFDSDNILAYVRADKIYARYQRERFTIEHEIATAYADVQLNKFGVSSGRRMMFEIQ